MGNYIYSLAYLPLFLVLIFLSIPVLPNGRIPVYTCFRTGFTIFALILFIAFRAYVYADWVFYESFYEKVPSLLIGLKEIGSYLNRGIEPGFVLYVSFCKIFSSEYLVFQAMSSLVDIVVLYYFFKQYIPDNIIMGFAAFYVWGLYMEMDLLRNVKAIMLFLISIKYLRPKKIIPYMLLNLAGILFHISSLFYIPFYFISNLKYRRVFIFLVWLTGNIIFLCRIKWMAGILSFMDTVLPIQRMSFLIQRYRVREIYSSFYGMSLGYIERQLTFLMIFLLQDKLIMSNKNNHVFINLAYIYLFIYLYFSEMFILAARIPQLFLCSYWILYPGIYRILKKENKYLFLCLFLAYGIIRIAYNNAMPERRYENFLFPHDSPAQRMDILLHD
ncbi:MAG: EpsG family protein [Bacteroidales bacterium]|jgi:hypothetical protein|nr:EpsG family protein [Bacteroidales bacterium]